jgi:hypothetical protein
MVAKNIVIPELCKPPDISSRAVLTCFWDGPGTQPGTALAKQRGAYKGRKKTLTPERTAELATRAGSGAPKAVLARDYGIGSEMVNQYLRHAKLG